MARQDTIDETAEADGNQQTIRGERPNLRLDQRSSLDRQPTERDRLIDSAVAHRDREHLERNLSLERERQLEMASSLATESETYDNGLREQPLSLAQRDLIATVLDMKVDVRLEMQRMSQRIGRIEDLLTELVKRLSNDSSGQSSPEEPIPIITTTVASPVATTSQTSLLSGSPATASSTLQSKVGIATSSTSCLGGNTLGPIILRKRRSKSRKAPAPPKTSPEQTRLLEAEIPPSTTMGRKREFL